MIMREPDELVTRILIFLGRFTHFSELSESSLSALAGSNKYIQVKKGQFIFLHDDPWKNAYLIRSRCFSILLESQDGWKLVINEMRAGDLFGEIAALTGTTRNADVAAVDNTNLLQVPAHTMRNLMGNPALSALLLAKMA
jgi:CRP/FNR family cyclic AMP-dependent transcriptional regulator